MKKITNKIFSFKGLGYLILILLVICGSSFAADIGELEEGAVTSDGLLIIEATKTTETQIKEDVDWAAYNRYQIDPVEISFRRNWREHHTRRQDLLSRQLTDHDVIRIREVMSRIVYSEFDDALKNKTNLEKVDWIDYGTLVFKPRIINLDLYTPPVHSPIMERTYARRTMQATMYLEVYDGVSGEILARWIDTREDPDKGFFEWVDRITVTERVRSVVRSWTDRMVEGLAKLRADN